MKPLLPLLLLGATLLAASSAGAQPQGAAVSPIEPGYWESTNRLLSPIQQSKVERRCITPADVEKFLAGPSNRHYDCTYPDRRIANGVIHLSGSCVKRKGGGAPIQVSGDGVYSRDSFSIDAVIATEFAGIPLSGRASTEARRIADTCPVTPAD
jgi:hypothetical protein